MRRLACAAALAAAALAAPAQAQRAASSPSAEGAEAAAPTPPAPPGFPAPLGNDIVYGGEVETHTQADVISSSRQATRVSVFNDTSVDGYVNYKNWLSVNTEAKLERNRNDNSNSFFVDRNAFFRSEGLTLRQLYVTVRPVEGLAIYGGKIHPNFGSAYEQAPGQFYNFGTDYEQDERIGFGVEYRLPLGGPGMLGLDNIRLAAETFFLDTSVLSNSALSRPSLFDPTADRFRRYSRNLLGPSNTGSFESGTISIRGGRPGRGLAWQVSATREGTDDPDGRTEYGQSVGASFDPSGDGIPLSPRLGVTPFLEYAHFSNFAGNAGLTRHYAVAGLSFKYVKWNLSVAAGLRSTSGVASAFDHQENVTLTYEIIPRFQLGMGINFVNIDARSSRALSPAISYTRAF